MRSIEVKLFHFNELSDKAKEKARIWWRHIDDEIQSQGEMFESLHALFNAAGVKLKDYQLGLGSYSFIKAEFNNEEIGHLSHGRAIGWLENNLLSKIRITRKEYLANRKAYLSYGSLYRIGKVKPCPFTSMCWDDTFLDALLHNIKQGSTLQRAFNELASTYVNCLQDEYDYQSSNEYIDDLLTANEYEFTENGKHY